MKGKIFKRLTSLLLVLVMMSSLATTSLAYELPAGAVAPVAVSDLVGAAETLPESQEVPAPPAYSPPATPEAEENSDTSQEVPPPI